MGRLIKTDSSSVDVSPKGETWNIHELYKLIECQTIDCLRILTKEGEPTEKSLIIDDEGKFRDEVFLNIEATILWWRGRMSVEDWEKHSAMLSVIGSKYIHKTQMDCIVGNVIIEKNELI